MKLELEFQSPSPSVSHQFAATANNTSETSEILQAGINFAKEGRREEARHFLLRVTAAEPENETAWLWLASISEYPEELLVFLQNVLNVNPNHERALEWQKATKSMLSKTFVDRGINASQENQKEFANQCFTQALLHDNQNETAWLWLASNSDSPEEKTAHLQKVLSINPENETALASLKSLKHEMSQSLLKKANFAAISGEREEARRLLGEAMQNAPELEEAWILKAYLADDSQEKIACYEKILDLNPENEAAQAGLASLKALMQRSVEQKSNAETLQEVFAAGGNEFLKAEKSFEFSKESEEPENLEILDEPLFEDSPEAQSEEFAFESHATESSVHKSFERPTDELDVNFVEQVKSQGAFSNEPFVEQNEFKQVSEPAEVTQASDQTNQAAAEFANQETGDSADETLNVFGDVNFEAAPEAEQPVENSSQSAEVANSYKTTVLEQDYLNKVTAESENFASHKEAPVRGEEAPEVSFDGDVEISLVEDESEEDEAENSIHRTPMPTDSFTCPFCYVVNDSQAIVCSSCHTMLSLSDMEMLLSHTGANSEVIGMAIEELESEKSLRGLNETKLINLALAYLNTKNFRRGLTCLQEAAQSNPNNIVLASKVNFLAIRLSEIEAHESKMEGTPTKNLTIMVVDDSPTVRKLISSKLEKSGHTVVLAADGSEAMQKINEVVPDLILVDIMMPQMDGYQVCKLIRSNEPTRDVPVVMISGKDGFFDKVRGRMAGTTGYITKPFGPETLMKTIETYVV